MSIFELYVPNTERWRGVFKKTGVSAPPTHTVDVQSGGRAQPVKLVTPSQQMIQVAESELKSPVHYDREGMAHSDSPKRSKSPSKRVKPAGSKKKPARRQVRSAPTKKKPKRAASSSSKDGPAKKKLKKK